MTLVLNARFLNFVTLIVKKKTSRTKACRLRGLL